jgi:UDP-N-acetylglucosamine 1-carboxyvinyltransferase
MAKFSIEGGEPLGGSIRVPGGKNAILPILAASLLTTKPVTIRDCPDLLDVSNMICILEKLGCSIRREGDTVEVDAALAHRWEMPDSLAKELRSSIFMLGPVLGRFRKARFTYPGGCEIGSRPIDLHLKGLRKLNVKIEEECGFILCDGENIRGGEIHLDYPSVGATENLMMAAVCAKGTTIIYNAAREPEIVDLESFLNGCGARISGAGTSTVEIEGINGLGSVEYCIMPDRIVAGTYMVASAITQGDVLLENVRPLHLQSVTHKLREVGCLIDVFEDSIRVRGNARPMELQLIETLPYPGFPTDMQPQMFALATIAEGTSVIIENVFDNRFKHASELSKMGANVILKGRIAIIRGVAKLSGTEVEGKDLRGGAALVLAGLRAEGTTLVGGVHHIDRGYEDLARELASLGATIVRVEDTEDGVQGKGFLEADGRDLHCCAHRPYEF